MIIEKKVKEEFVRIKSFEKFYLISNYGRIVSLHKRNKFLELKQYRQHNGYLVVHLRCNGSRLKRRVHKLVAISFIKNDDPGIKNEVHHKDSDKNNNYFGNLEWINHRQNMEWYHHRVKQIVQENHRTRKAIRITGKALTKE